MKVNYPEDWEGKRLTKKEKAFFECQGTDPFTKCGSCEDYAIDVLRQYDENAIEDAGYYSKGEKDGKFICFPCRESADSYPMGAVILYDPEEGTVTKYTVGEYEDLRWSGPEGLTSDELELSGDEFELDDCEESPIQFGYHRSDGWRGYYEPIIPEGWRKMHSDCILAHSEDARALEDFDTEIKPLLWDAGVKFALCFGRTSNVFSTGYDVLAEATDDDLKTLALLMRMNQLRAKHRDRGRFMRTALTGSGEDTPEAGLLVKYADKLDEGEDPDEAREEILAEAREVLGG